jgi:hypothetical protein
MEKTDGCHQKDQGDIQNAKNCAIFPKAGEQNGLVLIAARR